MLRCKVHNRTTGQRFEFIAADPSAVAAKLLDEPSYGRDAWTETLPAWVETIVDWVDPDGVTHAGVTYVEHPEQIIEHPAEYTVEVIDTSAEDAAARTAIAWAAANAHAATGMDENSRTSLLWLALDPSCPPWRMQRILAVQAWWAAVWAHYGTVKTKIASGELATYDPTVAGDCPWTIWQLAAE